MEKQIIVQRDGEEIIVDNKRLEEIIRFFGLINLTAEEAREIISNGNPREVTRLKYVFGVQVEENWDLLEIFCEYFENHYDYEEEE